MKSSPFTGKLKIWKNLTIVDEGDDDSFVGFGMELLSNEQAKYIVKACNAYPKLVEQLRDLTNIITTGTYSRIEKEDQIKTTESLLKELGEL